MQTLYEMYDRFDRLLYVGITCNPPSRFTQHRQTKDWWELVETIRLTSFTTRREVLSAEAMLIRDEEPAFNVSHPGADGDYRIGRCGFCHLLMVYEAADEYLPGEPLECPACNEIRSDAHASGAQWGLAYNERRGR